MVSSTTSRRFSRRGRHGNQERGALDMFMALVLGTLITFAGFTYDMGMFFNAHREAQNIATAAARAGADAVQVDVLYDKGEAKIDEGAAKTAARKLIPAHAIERELDATNDDTQFLVEIVIEHEPFFFKFLGTMQASGDAIATVANEAP